MFLFLHRVFLHTLANYRYFAPSYTTSLCPLVSSFTFTVSISETSLVSLSAFSCSCCISTGNSNFFSVHNYYFWIPVVAPLIGGPFGAWLYHFFVGAHIPEAGEEYLHVEESKKALQSDVA